MPIINRIADFHADMATWRHAIHAHPETAFEEERTAAFVAAKLESFGLAVHRGLARTGVVGTLTTGEGPSIGLRADLDALHIHEATAVPYKSQHDGRMHACGHDGHTAMLLGAARYLAETRRFRGTVHFIFQPAEENEGGGRVMVEEGLFERFPVEAVYGLHNWPGLPAGRFSVRAGPLMAGSARIEIVVQGKGTHAALPHTGEDAVLAAAQLVTALHTVIPRTVNAIDPAVLSITQIHGGDTWNVIPDRVVLRGTLRFFRDGLREALTARIHTQTAAIAAAHGVSAEATVEPRYPATINHAQEAEVAARAAAEVVGSDNVLRDLPPAMVSEDFAYLLNARPGCYVWLGNGPSDGGRTLHSPHYDFNDEILAVGASYWAKIVETSLA